MKITMIFVAAMLVALAATGFPTQKGKWPSSKWPDTQVWPKWPNGSELLFPGE